MFIQTKMQILCPGWIPDIQCIGCQFLQDLSNKMYRNDHLSENELLDTSKLFKSQAALGRWSYLKAHYQRTLPLMSRNQCLARLIGRLVSRLHQILGKPLRTKSTAVAAATYASWPPWTEPLSPQLGGKVAPQGLGGPSRNTESSSTGLQADRTLDWKMCMIEHCLIYIFVYLPPPLEYMLPEIQTLSLNFKVASLSSRT